MASKTVEKPGGYGTNCEASALYIYSSQLNN